ncbi:hypothetical protein [Melittangium boletus]|uniref:Uncharacterized protein n=1 Tax=Melittangium boletus DSM 14713 TaxID=1294270 RepID=A0A250IGG4_9BACT|nr:hypothetical protein [Melittangium boletus]ATB30310.1 hypothetical protein MEBOL_003770 [Melittangium boletus DSM 14713]
MRLAVSLMCLGLLGVQGVARAQQQPTPAYVPPPVEQTAPVPAPQYVPPPPSQGPVETPGERAERYSRYSRFSSGEGGLLLIFTELIGGAVTGAFYGHSLENRNGAYVGGVVTGLTLGTAAAVYQYYVPVERNEAALSAAGAALGFLAGFGYGTQANLSDKSRAVTALLTTQLGIIGVLAATAPVGDVSDGDTSLVAMSALYAFVLTGLTQATVALANEGKDRINLAPSLVAPLVGMGIGGLLAVPFELRPSRVFKLTALPLGVGAVLLVVGTALADGPAVPLSAMGGVAATFVITLLATADEPNAYPPSHTGRRLRSQRADSFKAMPVPVFMRSGERGDSLTAGPGMMLRF